MPMERMSLYTSKLTVNRKIWHGLICTKDNKRSRNYRSASSVYLCCAKRRLQLSSGRLCIQCIQVGSGRISPKSVSFCSFDNSAGHGRAVESSDVIGWSLLLSTYAVSMFMRFLLSTPFQTYSCIRRLRGAHIPNTHLQTDRCSQTSRDSSCKIDLSYQRLAIKVTHNIFNQPSPSPSHHLPSPPSSVSFSHFHTHAHLNDTDANFTMTTKNDDHISTTSSTSTPSIPTTPASSSSTTTLTPTTSTKTTTSPPTTPTTSTTSTTSRLHQQQPQQQLQIQLR